MKHTYREVLDAAAKAHVPDEINLFPHIAGQLQRKTFMKTFRTRPAFAVLTTLLTLILLSGVAYAVGRSLGYIPGVGIIDQTSPVRVLAEPVTIERDGVKLTVTEGVLTGEKTVLLFTVENLPWDALSHQEDVTGCTALPSLRLPDGTVLVFEEGGGGMNGWRFAYPSIPADINEIVFTLPCIMNTLPGLAPENWEIPLHFIPAPEDKAVIPVIEITPTIEPGRSEALDMPPVLINNSLMLRDHYIVTGVIQSPESAPWFELIGTQVVDAEGKQVPTQVPVLPGLPYFDWGIQFSGETVTFPITLTFNWITKAIVPDSYTELEFDAGENPQPGQKWEFSLPINIGERNITLETIQVSSENGYTFHFSAEPEIAGVSVQIAGITAGGGGGGGNNKDQDSNTFSISLDFEELPTGKLKIILSNLLIVSPIQTGTLQWSPPDDLPVVEAVTPIDSSKACLTIEGWQQAMEQNTPLPSNLGGQLVITINEGGMLPAIYITDLNGTVLHKIGNGSWPSFSKNGKYLVFSTQEGLRLADLSSGEQTGLGVDGYRLIWSPDDTRIFFTTSLSLSVITLENLEINEIKTTETQLRMPVAWLPDNQTILYSVLGTGGFDLKSLNLVSGQKEELGKLRNKAGSGELSPDGEWLAFADLEPEATSISFKLSRIDGSEQRTILEPGTPAYNNTIWSPDGNWLLFNSEISDNEFVAILVNPFTCQAIRLPVIGVVQGWSN